MSGQSTFPVAAGYCVASAAISIGGICVATASTIAAIQVTALAISIIGAYGIVAAIICGLENAGNPQGFKNSFSKYLGGTIAYVVSQLLARIATEMLLNIICGNRRRAF